MNKAIAILIGSFFLSFTLSAHAKGASSGGRPSYSGGSHTSNHGGHYQGGTGSSHKGGEYKNPPTNNRYGKHK